MHARASGPRRLPRRGRGRRACGSAATIVARLNWRKRGPGADRPADAAAVRRGGAARRSPAPTCGCPFDPREVLARVVDGSDFDEFKPLYGTVAGHRLGEHPRLPGRRAGQRPRRAVQRGVAEGGAVHPARQPADTPLLFLQNTTGYMVGKEYEQGGIIKHGAKMINAVSNSHGPAPDGDDRRVLRRRQLRHVRPGLRPAVPVRLAATRSRP